MYDPIDHLTSFYQRQYRGPFKTERQMNDHFANNLNKLEPYLVRCGNRFSDGVEYPILNKDGTVFSVLDLFAADCRGGLVIIECKLRDATHSTVGQIAAYYAAMRECVPKHAATLRVFVLCRRATVQFWYALRHLAGIKVEVFAYQEDLTVTRLKPPPRVRKP
jgi:RecB family endonuclease NucS